MATIYNLGDSSASISVLANNLPFVSANDQFNFNSLSGISRHHSDYCRNYCPDSRFYKQSAEARKGVDSTYPHPTDLPKLPIDCFRDDLRETTLVELKKESYSRKQNSRCNNLFKSCIHGILDLF